MMPASSPFTDQSGASGQNDRLADIDPSRQPVIIAALRTPVCRANGALKRLRAADLLAPVLSALMEQTGAEPADVDDVMMGNAVGGGGNVARFAALQAGLPVSVPGITVDRQCGSGLDAIALASRLVAAGGDPLYLAGGVESVSTAPARAHRNDDGGLDFYSRAAFVPPTFGDPDMGVAAEIVARHFAISRDRQDDFALRSHQRAVASASAGTFLAETVPLDVDGRPVTADDGPKPNLRPALMARFPAAFVPEGSVTAANSCFDADAAAAVVVTSLRRARLMGVKDGLLVLDSGTSGVEPQLLGIGAAFAAEQLLARHGMNPEQLDLVEFNEAFASQTLACLDHLGIDAARANLDGGALALGHAYGASGAVLVTRLLAQARRDYELRQREVTGIAMISIAGGMGTAALVKYRRF